MVQLTRKRALWCGLVLAVRQLCDNFFCRTATARTRKPLRRGGRLELGEYTSCNCSLVAKELDVEKNKAQSLARVRAVRKLRNDGQLAVQNLLRQTGYGFART